MDDFADFQSAPTIPLQTGIASPVVSNFTVTANTNQGFANFATFPPPTQSSSFPTSTSSQATMNTPNHGLTSDLFGSAIPSTTNTTTSPFQGSFMNNSTANFAAFSQPSINQPLQSTSNNMNVLGGLGMATTVGGPKPISPTKVTLFYLLFTFNDFSFS